MYRGLGASYLGVVETTLHLTLYERMKILLARQKEGISKDKKTWNQATGWMSVSRVAGISKLFAVLIAYPHEAMFKLLITLSVDR